MKSFFVIAVFVGLIFTISGCAKVGVKFNESELINNSPQSAIVYFYRPYAFIGRMYSWPIIANGVEIASIDNDAYVKKNLKPDTYKLHSKSSAIDRISTFDFEAGKTYFVKCLLDEGVWVNSIRFVSLDKNDALLEIEKTSLQ